MNALVQTARVQSLLRAYYFVLLGVINALALPWSIETGLYPELRWPLGVFTGTDIGLVLLITALLLMASAAWAGCQPLHQIPRVCVFLSLFLMNAAINSRGATTHLYQFWLWSSFMLALIPSSASLSPRERARNLWVGWSSAQSMVLLFYGLSGLWKLIGVLIQWWNNEPHFLGYGGIAYHLASEKLRADSRPILGDFLLNHPGWSPVFATAVMGLQLLCWVGIVRPDWRRPLGLGLIGFHLSTYLGLSITYPPNVFLVGMLLATNPFSMGSWRFWRRRWRWRRNFRTVCAGILVVYTVAAFAMAIFSSRGEVFPFFNGHWFVHVPHTQEDYGLYITHLDGEELKEGFYIEHDYRRFRAWAFAIYGAIQNWGEAADRNSKEIQRHREFALRLIFGDRPFQAELRHRRIRLLDFIQNRAVESERTLEKVTNHHL